MTNDLKALRRETVEKLWDLTKSLTHNQFIAEADEIVRDYALAVLRTEPSDRALFLVCPNPDMWKYHKDCWHFMCAERAKEIG